MRKGYLKSGAIKCDYGYLTNTGSVISLSCVIFSLEDGLFMMFDPTMSIREIKQKAVLCQFQVEPSKIVFTVSSKLIILIVSCAFNETATRYFPSFFYGVDAISFGAGTEENTFSKIATAF